MDVLPMVLMISLAFMGCALTVAIWVLYRRDEKARFMESLTATASANSGIEVENPNGRSRFVILHNPTAGQNDIDLVGRVVEELRGRGAVVDLRELTKDLPQASTLTESYDAVVVSGGDGSIRSVAAAYTTTIALGIIPNGTGNVLAGELALPRNAEDIAELLVHGPAHLIQGGTVQDAPFLLMFGAGFDGEVVKRLSRATLRSMGKLAYFGPVLSALLTRPYLFEIDTDGARSWVSWVLISNVAHYAGRFRLTKMTSIHELGLVAVMSRATTRRQRVGELLRLAFGNLSRAPTIEMKRVQRAHILPSDVPAQVDGEALSPGPCVVQRGVFATRIIAPLKCTGDGPF